jgi:FKBP12-rapamycin complex-associated protein
MGVLRDNKESLMAVLEAFVYDPLINWRLMQHDVEARRAEPGGYIQLGPTFTI